MRIFVWENLSSIGASMEVWNCQWQTGINRKSFCLRIVAVRKTKQTKNTEREGENLSWGCWANEIFFIFTCALQLLQSIHLILERKSSFVAIVLKDILTNRKARLYVLIATFKNDGFNSWKQKLLMGLYFT